MPNHPRNTIPRREFLRGTAAAVGASALGTSPVAQALGLGRSSVAVSYWDGSRFAPAERIVGGDASLTRVRLTVDAGGRPGALTSLDAMFLARVDGEVRPTPFRAWTSGGATARFEMPVEGYKGIALSVNSAPSGTSSEVRLAPTGLGGLKLREGVYVVTTGKANLSGIELEDGIGAGRLVSADGSPAAVQHILIRVERA